MRRPTNTWKRSICPSTTGVLPRRRQNRRTITDGNRRCANYVRFSAWRPSAESVTIGWSGTRIVFCNCNLGNDADLHKVRLRSAKEGWNDRGVLPRGKDRIYRIAGTDTKTGSLDSALDSDGRGKESQSRPSVATKLQIYGFSDGTRAKSNTTRCTAHFRYALKGFAPVRSATTTLLKKGDTSNELRTGTFLKSFDTYECLP